MPRPCCRGSRATPAPHPHFLHGVLQCSPNASLITQGCAGSKYHSARWAHRSAACPWGTASSMRADLIFGRGAITSLKALREAEAECTRCPLYKHATQVVPREAPGRSRLMLVGERPGYHADKA